MKEFQPFCEKSTTFDVRLFSISAQKDLLALVTDDDLILIYRIAYKTQKITSVEEDIKVISLAFEGRGEGICVGSDEGCIKVYKLSSQGLRLVGRYTLPLAPVTFLCWNNYEQACTPLASSVADLIPGARLDPDQYFQDFSILSLHNTEQIGLLANGALPISVFSASDLLQQPLQLHSLKMAGSLDRFVCLFTDGPAYSLGTFNCMIIEKRSQCFMEIAYTHSLCSELLNTVTNAIKDMQKDWQLIKNA